MDFTNHFVLKNKLNKMEADMMYDWKSKTILIAEDEEDNLELLDAILEITNAKIVKALNGKEVVHTFKNIGNIDLILMDIKMPEMDGLKATKEIREIDKKIPIIAQTAYALTGDKEKALAAGCTSYIPKPIDGDRLLKMISEYL